MRKTKKTSSSMLDAKKLLRRLATSMAKMVDDLAKLRPVAEEIKNKLDDTSEKEMADCMYITAIIPDPETIW